MNIKKILVAVFALSTTIAFAQEQRIKEESKTIFKPHWFIQAQIGAAHTVGEGELLILFLRQLLLMSVTSLLPHSAHVSV